MDIAAGAELPPFTRRADFAAWNRYAAVNDEFVGIHMDDAAGQAAGFPGAIAMGNLALSYLHNLLRGWIDAQWDGPRDGRARIAGIAVSYRQPVLRGSTVTAHGRIAAVAEGSDGAGQATIDLWLEDETGRGLLTGTAVVEWLDA